MTGKNRTFFIKISFWVHKNRKETSSQSSSYRWNPFVHVIKMFISHSLLLRLITLYQFLKGSSVNRNFILDLHDLAAQIRLLVGQWTTIVWSSRRPHVPLLARLNPLHAPLGLESWSLSWGIDCLTSTNR